MKIGFLLHNKGIKDKVITDLETGNPGIGGTEYMILCVVYYLKKINTKHEITLFVESDKNIPAGIPTEIFDSDADLIDKIDSSGIDLVVARYAIGLYRNLSKCATAGLVFWLHNFVAHTELNMLGFDPKVKALVCVSKEQLNQYRDYHAFYKSVAIFNGYPIRNIVEKKLGKFPSYAERSNEVTYIGHISKDKGFHLLAKAWPKVIATVPDARLNVIGSGKLYNNDTRLGSYGIAEERYENMFMPYLTDSDGKVLPSVKFWGILGEEKFDVLKHTKIGVPNPSGVSETFCITAIEMQIGGCIATTIRANGLIDTVYTTGLLYDDTEQLADCIIELFKRSDNDYDGFLKWAEKFEFDYVVKQWETLFDTLERNGDLKDIRNDDYPSTCGRYKWQELNRRIKKIIPMGHKLPTCFDYKVRFKKYLGFLINKS